MKVNCDNCGYEWQYRGKNQWYLTCPKCKNMININELTKSGRTQRKNGKP
jgi:predicted Zn-ribbon and HTH transcriptional regulator